MLGWWNLGTVVCLLVPLLVPRWGNSSPGPNCVDECTDDPGANVLALVPAEGSECLKPGQDGCFELWQRNLKQRVRGWQAFIYFDPGCMQIQDIQVTDEPYGSHFLVRWNNTLGTIDLIVGIRPDQEPTEEDALLARICFRAGEQVKCGECGICFRPHDPPTRFADEQGRHVEPCLKFAKTLIDGTPPHGECPPVEVSYACRDQVPECDPNLPGWSDDCSDLSVDCEDKDNGGAGCPDNPLIIQRTWTATDCAGNTSSCRQVITVIDDEAPIITKPPQGVTIECNGQQHEEEFREWLERCGNGTAVDNCGLVVCEPRYEKLSGCCGTWYADVVFRFRDGCGNYVDSDPVRFEVVDNTPPVIDPKAQNETVECDPNRNDEQFEKWLARHGGAQATDACCPREKLTWSWRYERVRGCCETWYADVIFTVTDECGNQSETTARFTVVDTTPPAINAPPDENVECDPNVNESQFEQWLKSATAEDVCCGSVPVTWDYTIVPGCCQTWYADVVFRAADSCGNRAETRRRFTVRDTRPPVIDPKAKDETVECDPNRNDEQFEKWLARHGGAQATDACCTQEELTWSWRYEIVQGCCETWYADVIFTVTDECGNPSETRARFTVVDTTPPEFRDGCGELVKVFPNVGECDARVKLAVPQATDLCCEEVLVEGFRDDGRSLEDPFPIGDTTIFWFATDGCGNEEFCVQVVQVEPDNLMDVYVELQGRFQNSVRRCVHFEVFTCNNGDNGLPRDEVIQFLRRSDRATGSAKLRVPACPSGKAKRYSCVTAQDLLHTLRATVSPRVVEYEDADGTVRTKYLVEFKDPPERGGHWLLGGNWDTCQYPEGHYIDILDFGVWSWQLGKSYDCDGDGRVDGNSSCGCVCFPHADANGDGRVDTVDLNFWVVNLLKFDEEPCCERPDDPSYGEAGPLAGPVLRISVEELRARGWGELAAGDWNHDGWLDMKDVEFLLGGRDVVPIPKSPPGGQAD